MTEWRAIPGFPGYEVSDDGRVMSHKGPEPRVLRPGAVRGGYPFVVLIQEGRRRGCQVHTLVALAFHGPRPAGTEIRHLDGDPANNVPSNLRYGTHSENMQDAIDHGRNRDASKTHCKRGHEFTPENTYNAPSAPSHHRMCRTCARTRDRKQAAA